MSRCNTARALLAALTVFTAQVVAHADIYRWDTGEVIPGTEGIEPGPGVDLSGMELEYAELSLGGWPKRVLNLTDANFEASNLANANFDGTKLTNADFTGAMVTGATFHNTTSSGFSKEQLYSTASYQQRILHGIDLSSNDLRGWSFNSQELAGANFGTPIIFTPGYTNLSDADFEHANLTNTSFAFSDLSGANFGDANLTNHISKKYR